MPDCLESQQWNCIRLFASARQKVRHNRMTSFWDMLVSLLPFRGRRTIRVQYGCLRGKKVAVGHPASRACVNSEVGHCFSGALSIMPFAGRVYANKSPALIKGTVSKPPCSCRVFCMLRRFTLDRQQIDRYAVRRSVAWKGAPCRRFGLLKVSAYVSDDRFRPGSRSDVTRICRY